MTPLKLQLKFKRYSMKKYIIICSLLLLYPLTMICADPKPQAQQKHEYTLQRECQVRKRGKIKVISTLINNKTGRVYTQEMLYYHPDKGTIKWQGDNYIDDRKYKGSVFPMRIISAKAHCKFFGRVSGFIRSPSELPKTEEFFHFDEKDIADIDPYDIDKYSTKKTTLLDKTKAALD